MVIVVASYLTHLQKGENEYLGNPASLTERTREDRRGGIRKEDDEKITHKKRDLGGTF